MADRYIVLLRIAAPLGGICPVCDRPIDASGCRIGAHWRVREPARIRTGIAQVIEVFCIGTPTSPVVPCPSCAERTT